MNNFLIHVHIVGPLCADKIMADEYGMSGIVFAQAHIP